MRKVLAVFLAATLLCVSSVPAFAEAASCAGPESALAMDNEHAEHHDDGIEDAHLGHDHVAGLQGDWQKDRIECGCGCHNSIDSLPHLLAPHNITTASFNVENGSDVVALQSESALVVSVARVPLPPPQSIS